MAVGFARKLAILSAMTLDALIMLAGALVAFLSVAGFPPSLYKPMFFILGVFVIALGIVVRRRRGDWETMMRKSGQMPSPIAPASTHEEEEQELV
jgi:hypothetical protein